MKIVILAGGAGTRLWPMSTQEKPKQFQKLVSEKTMLQETYERIAFVDPSDIYVSTNQEYRSLVQDQLPMIPEENILAEPCRRDTAPCIGYAAAMIAKKDPEAVMAVIYADHLVQDMDEFKHKLEVTAKIAQEQETFNIIEVRAKAPNINLGYVKVGEKLEVIDDVDVYSFEAFKEKPDLETAREFLKDGSYLWNTGFYVWKVSKILDAFQKHMPETHKQLLAIQEGEDLQEHYAACERISIDYGIMEKLDPSEVRIIPADLGWSDIGTWSSLHEELAGNTGENITKGDVVMADSHGCLVYNESSDQKIATFGVNDLVIVQAGGYTLVCPKARSAELKKLIKKLEDESK